MTDRGPRREDGAAGAPATPRMPAFDLDAAFRGHHDFVWRSLAQLGVVEAAIDDAVQDVFVIAHRRGDDYDGRAPLRHWLYGIARNVALKHRDRLARARARSGTHDGEPTHECDEDLLLRRDAASVVERFLETLDGDQRVVFVLADVEGHSAPEIATMLAVKLNTVYSRLRLARGRFEQYVAAQRQKEDARWIR